MYWTGVATWALVAMYLTSLLYEAARGAVIAVDWIWWRIKLCREHKIQIRWGSLPKAFATRWYDFTLSWAVDHSWCGEYGCWTGFRQWVVYPKTPNV